MLTTRELAERLKSLDECLLCEVLSLTSEDIVERCMDIIENKYYELAAEFEEDGDTE